MCMVKVALDFEKIYYGNSFKRWKLKVFVI